MDLHVLVIVHTLPLWFLVFSLFLPRVSLFLLWLGGGLLPFHLRGIVPLVFAVLLPRLLVLFLIYMDLGVGLWFILHLVAALMVGGGRGGGGRGGGGITSEGGGGDGRIIDGRDRSCRGRRRYGLPFWTGHG
jgi:uncharacterized membrane protein YgcG